ncbi:DUF6194 family protein [Microbacterium sp. NPDC056234]|uniref:DUF6194 family protein n=1 Tax=Microbacterium sp. NPDC056234 TaxID=3345757 RepID=UPI0035DF3424
MEMHEIVDHIRSLEGALVIEPDEGSAFPPLAWGDAFFYYAPDGVMPERTQPYGTIITKDYPEDAKSGLDAPDRFRVNIHIGRERLAEFTSAAADPAAPDAIAPHPVYGDSGWVSIVNPGIRTGDAVLELLRGAHQAARARTDRRRRTT